MNIIVKKEKMDDDSNEEISGMDMDKKEENQVDEETTQQSRETWMMYEDSPAQNIFAVNEKVNNIKWNLYLYIYLLIN